MATGASANLKWGLETTFGTEAGTVDQPFGYAVELSNLDMDNDPIARRGLGSRNLQKMGFGMFKGSMTLKFDLANPFVFRLITGGYGSTGAYQYTFSEALTLPSFTVYDYIESIDTGVVDTLRKYLGCVVLDATFDVAVGNEPCSLTLNVAFAEVVEATTEQTPVFPTMDLLIFAHAVWAKAGVAIAKTESVSISINQNSEIKPYLGSRFGQRAKFGDREYDITSLHYYGSTSSYIQDFYGSTPNTGPVNTGPIPRTYTLVLTPMASQDAPTYTFTFTTNYPVKHGQPKFVGEDIMEDVSMVATSMTLVVVNDSDIEPSGW